MNFNRFSHPMTIMFNAIFRVEHYQFEFHVISSNYVSSKVRSNFSFLWTILSITINFSKSMAILDSCLHQFNLLLFDPSRSVCASMHKPRDQIFLSFHIFLGSIAWFTWALIVRNSVPQLRTENLHISVYWTVQWKLSGEPDVNRMLFKIYGKLRGQGFKNTWDLLE